MSRSSVKMSPPCLLVTVMPEMLAPDRPDNENSVLAVSCVQTVFDPVAVIVIVVFS